MNYIAPILLLICSNVFMNFAWYGHLKKPDGALWKIILLSYGIAFFEYILMVPANRIGAKVYSAFELKIIQEVITLIVFTCIAVFYLDEKLKWNYIVGFVLMVLAVFFVFKKW